MTGMNCKKTAACALKLFLLSLLCAFTIKATGNVYAENRESLAQQYDITTEGSVSPDTYEDDDTSSLASVVVIDFATTQQHNFHDAGDKDWGKFYGMAGEGYMIETINPESNCDSVIELYGSNGTTQIVSRDIKGAGVGESLSWDCVTEGRYYVKISNADSNVFGENTGYKLRIYRRDLGTTGIIIGVIKDQISKSTIDEALITTNGGGSAYSVDGVYLISHEPGTFTLTVTANGYKTYTAPITVSGGGTTNQDILLEPVTTSTTSSSSTISTTTISTTTSVGPTTSTVTTTSTPVTSSTSTAESSTTSTSADTTTTTTVEGATTTTSTPITITSTTTTLNVCPAVTVAGGDNEALGLLRQFRDRKLMTTAAGREYVWLYYKHAKEVALMLQKDHEILSQAEKALKMILPVIESIMQGKKAAITKATARQINEVLDKISSNSGTELRHDIETLKKDIHDGKIVPLFSIIKR